MLPPPTTGGDVIQPPKNMSRTTRPTSISFEDDFLEKIDNVATTMGLSRSQFVIHCIRQEMISARKGTTTMSALPVDLQPKARPGGRGGSRKKTSRKKQ